MSDNKLVETNMGGRHYDRPGRLHRLDCAEKMVKENFTADPSGNVMNYAKFTVVMAGRQRRAEKVSRGPEDSSNKLKKRNVEMNCQHCDDDRWSGS